mmetsp:Transcript_79041/g.228508  ORF Transcript_79041/g.228508 Transcript_79041/m.228508 type:complete len:204 (-) Transcript_79041:730-1341(-)
MHNIACAGVEAKERPHMPAAASKYEAEAKSRRDINADNDPVLCKRRPKLALAKLTSKPRTSGTNMNMAASSGEEPNMSRKYVGPQPIQKYRTKLPTVWAEMTAITGGAVSNVAYTHILLMAELASTSWPSESAGSFVKSLPLDGFSTGGRLCPNKDHTTAKSKVQAPMKVAAKRQPALEAKMGVKPSASNEPIVDPAAAKALA